MNAQSLNGAGKSAIKTNMITNNKITKKIVKNTNVKFNPYDQSSLQLAKNITNYRYGKRIGGMM